PGLHPHPCPRPRALHHVRLPRRRLAASFTFRDALLQLKTLIPLLSTRGPGRVEQVVRLLDRVPVRGVRWRAELREPELVLDLEDGLALTDEVRRVAVALAVLLALLVDRVVEVRTQVGQLLDIVLQCHGEP